MIAYLKEIGAIPNIIDSKTENPKEIMRNADIIITSVGKADIVKPDMIKNGVILVGVGLYQGEDGKLYGDYDESAIEAIASYYTPTPGGIGPINVAMLLSNLVTAAENQS